MAHGHPISRLGGWEGYVVTEDWNEIRAGQPVWVIRLEPIRGHRRHCSGCGALSAAIDDLEARRVRDLPKKGPLSRGAPRITLARAARLRASDRHYR